MTERLTSVQSKSVGEVIRALPGMSEIEERVRSKFSSDARLLEEIPSYLLELGGKRIRPALCLLAARFSGLTSLPTEVIDVASGIELIHMATLLHDDIIDRSPVRRGKQAPHLAFGENNTLLAGDFLLVRAFALCAHLDHFIVRETEEACIRLTEGEILETPLHSKNFTVSESLNIAEKKTAALFGLAAVAGAHLAEAPKVVEDHLKDFGLTIGVAFQILDDILDVTADENLLGKRCGGDLVEQKPSLVNVLWLESEESFANEILLSPTPVDSRKIEQALQHLRGDSQNVPHPVIQNARRIAEEKIDEATNHLEIAASVLAERSPLTDHQQSALSALETLLQFTLNRLK